MKRVLLFGIVVLLSVSVGAEPPPRESFDAMDWPSSVNEYLYKFVEFGSFRIYFEKTTLGEVQRATRVGAIDQAGDAGAHELWLCYTVAEGPIRSRVWVISDGEMGGDSHRVTRFAAALLSNEPPTADCPALPARMELVGLEIQHDRTIWLLTSEEELESGLGAPSHKERGWNVYIFKTKVPGQCEGGFDRLNWMTTKLEHERVTLLYVGQVTSC